MDDEDFGGVDSPFPCEDDDVNETCTKVSPGAPRQLPRHASLRRHGQLGAGDKTASRE